MESLVAMFGNAYGGKTVLISGHAGFKGSWLAYWLTLLGAKVVGYSLVPEGDYALYDVLNLKGEIADSLIADICDAGTLEAFFQKHNPDIVFHLAAQPLVRYSYSNPVETYKTNVIGTLNMLEAARKTPSVKAFVNVTTDKCYENREKREGYTEDEAMGGYDMYSSSKGCSEILTASYRRSFLANGTPFLLATGRAGNVIGGGDWAADRLIPDCIRAFASGKKVHIRNPLSTRPWQHVLEPLAGYMLLGWKLLQGGENFAQSYNFGPEQNLNVKVCNVAKKAAEFWGGAEVEVGSADGLHEANFLQLNIDKAKRELGFLPVWSVEKAVEESVRWYCAFYSKSADMALFTKAQIEDFARDARQKQIQWSL